MKYVSIFRDLDEFYAQKYIIIFWDFDEFNGILIKKPCFQHHVMNTYIVHMTRNYVLWRFLRTRSQIKLFLIFHVCVSYMKTLTKTDCCIFWH